MWNIPHPAFEDLTPGKYLKEHTVYNIQNAAKV
jgi:hypothetical protein